MAIKKKGKTLAWFCTFDYRRLDKDAAKKEKETEKRILACIKKREKQLDRIISLLERLIRTKK